MIRDVPLRTWCGWFCVFMSFFLANQVLYFNVRYDDYHSLGTICHNRAKTSGQWDWDSRHKEMINLSRCKNNGLDDCLHHAWDLGSNPNLIHEVCKVKENEKCWRSIEQFPLCTQDINSLCFSVIEGLQPLGKDTTRDMFIPPQKDFEKMMFWKYFQLRNEVFQEASTKNKIFDFWSDKQRTKDCTSGIFDGVKFTQSLCTIIPNQTPFDATHIQKNIEKCMDELGKQSTYSNIIVKPNHSTEHKGVKACPAKMLINNPKNTISRYTFVQRINSHENLNEERDGYSGDYINARKGSIMEEFFNVWNPETKPWEIRFYAVFGEIVSLSHSGAPLSHGCFGELSPYDNGLAQMHKTFKNEWECTPPDNRKGVEGSNWHQNQQECCDVLEEKFVFRNAIKDLETFTFYLHFDLIRLDIFPTSETTFVINELEVNSGLPFVDENFILSKLKYGWKRTKLFKRFITVKKALEDLSGKNENCDIQINEDVIEYSKNEQLFVMKFEAPVVEEKL